MIWIVDRRWVFRTALIVCCLAAGLAAGGEPSASGDNEVPWGSPKGGLQVSLWVEGAPAIGSKFIVGAAVRNVAGGAVNMPAAENTFGWLILQQEKDQFFTQRIDLVRDVKNWPKELPSDKRIDLGTFDLSSTVAYRYHKGLKFLKEYKANQQLKVKPAGPVNGVFKTGKVMGRLYVYMEPDGRATLLKSNVIEINFAPPNFAKLSEEEKIAFVDGLLRQFDKDAFAARAAHRTAVRVGKDLIPYLLKAVFQTKRPRHSRIWITVTLANMPDNRCAEALIKLLGDGVVRVYIAYHGPKQRNKELDNAITAHAEQLKAERFTGYALLGFLAFGKTVPPKLLKLGLDSPDPRTRAAAAEVLKKIAGSARTIQTLIGLLKDTDPRVRATAARVLGYVGNRSPQIIDALIAALDTRDDLVRKRACGALGHLTDKNMPYNSNAPRPEKEKTIRAWKDWWKKKKQPADQLR